MEMLTIGIQKEGRLTDESNRLLHKAGIQLSPIEKRVDYITAQNYPIAVTLLRASDIARAVGRGHLDFGIVGQDTIAEQKTTALSVIPLGFGQCDIRLGTRNDRPYTGITTLDGAIIATSFPNITTNFFDNHRVKVDILEMEGSVELAVRQGWADACTDITSTGISMRQNGIEPRDLIMHSEATLIAKNNLGQDRGRQKIVEQLLSQIILAIYATNENIPPNLEEILCVPYDINHAIIEAVRRIYEYD